MMSIPRELPFDWIRPPFTDLNSLRENVFLLPATTYDISPYLMRFRHKLKEQCDIEEAKDSDKFRVFAWLCGCSYVDMLWAYYYIIGDDEFLRKIVEIVLFSEKRCIKINLVSFRSNFLLISHIFHQINHSAIIYVKFSR